MAPYDGRIEGVDPTAISLAYGRTQHLPEKSDSAHSKAAALLILQKRLQALKLLVFLLAVLKKMWYNFYSKKHGRKAVKTIP